MKERLICVSERMCVHVFECLTYQDGSSYIVCGHLPKLGSLLTIVKC